jgi:hypothetical protein
MNLFESRSWADALSRLCAALECGASEVATSFTSESCHSHRIVAKRSCRQHSTTFITDVPPFPGAQLRVNTYPADLRMVQPDVLASKTGAYNSLLPRTGFILPLCHNPASLL